MKLATLSLFLVGALSACAAFGKEKGMDWKQYEQNPFVIRMEIPGPDDSAGGIIVADVDNDGRMDYLVTVPGHIAVYGNDGRKLWVKKTDVRVGGQSESQGLPGHHGPGLQAGDIDGDGKAEVIYLTQDSVLHVVEGATGREKWTAKPPIPEGAERWEMTIIANLRGKGDRDLLLQATNKDGYRLGRHLAAYAIEDLKAGNTKPLWQRDDYFVCAHNGARIADLDGDGRDEILGGTIYSPEGKPLFTVPLQPLKSGPHLDSIFVNDVRPDIPGLEVVALEEGGENRVFLYNTKELIWETHHKNQEPQNAALGQFSASDPGMEVWCRSRYNQHQLPFVFDSRGKLIHDYKMDDVAPEGWTVSGVEVIHTIDWTGERKQLAAAKERHTSGDVGLFDPETGKFVERWKEKADRLYVADVSGDWREEVIVMNGSELHIYHNDAPNPRPDQPRLWDKNAYRRSKMTHNYYSP